MTEYQEQPIGIDGFTSIETSSGWEKICLYLALEDDSKGLIFNLNSMYYLPNSPCNLVSLACLNDNDIYYDNKNETLYHCITQRVLAQAKR